MNTILAIGLFLVTRGPQPQPATFTVEDYDTRYHYAVQQARLSKVELPDKVAEEKVFESRSKDYPSVWSLRQKRARYALELKLIEKERDSRDRAASRKMLEDLVKSKK